MNTDELTAPGTGPSFLFVSYELSYAGLLYVHEIVDHAHAILGPIALIQVIQPVAREAVTAEAVPGPALHELFTRLDPARDAGLCFDAVVAPTAGACLRVSGIRVTEATVHSAGSDQRRWNRFCPWRSSRHYVPLPVKTCVVIPFYFVFIHARASR
jgi:hypothetical protein